MITVYWTEHSKIPNLFQTESLTAALSHCEALRVRGRNGEAISAVTLVSEDPNSVGLPGVAEPDSNYNWKKRR